MPRSRSPSTSKPPTSTSPPTLRRRFNQAFFTKIYIDEDGTIRADLAEPFGILLDAADRIRDAQR